MLPRATENSVAGHIRPAGLWLDHTALHNAQCQLVVPILVLFTSNIEVWTFLCLLLFYMNRHYLV